jgi:hypothetical protein
MQDFAEDTSDDDVERREARNVAHLAFVKVALIGGAEVVAAARRVMINIDAFTCGANHSTASNITSCSADSRTRPATT